MRSRSRLPNFVKALHMDLIKKSKKRAFEVTLTADDVMDCWKRQKGMCALSAEPMMHSSVHNAVSPFLNTTIDRIDMSKPYSRQNCHLVCARASQSKGEMGVEEYVGLCRKVTRQTDKRVTRRASFP
jgi:hypothetical protein